MTESQLSADGRTSRFDPDTVSFHREAMGVTFPSVGQPRQPLRSGRPVMIYPSAVELLSRDAIWLYTVIALLAADGQEVGPADFDEDFAGDRAHAQAVVDELFDAGLLITPAFTAARRQAYRDEQAAERAQMEAEREARRIKGPPVPWPSYGTGRWEGDRASRQFPGGLVVYRLYDERQKLLYVGSSKNMQSRIPGHFDKPWITWQAREVQSSDNMLWLEAAEIVWGKPSLNRDRVLLGRAHFVPKSRSPGSHW